MADTGGGGKKFEDFGENINQNPDFQQYTNDLLYDNKITWEQTNNFFNDSEYGLNNSKTQESKLKIFGIPWYLYPELSGRELDIWDNNMGYIRGKKKYKNNDGSIKSNKITGPGLSITQRLIKERILDSTVTIRQVPRDDDPYGNIYRQMNNLLGGANQLLTFLTTKQWTNREALHQDIENKQVSLYTDLITEETHNNVQYQITNTIDENKLKHFGEIFSNMISSTIFGPFYEYGTEYGFKGLMGMGEGLFGGIFAFHHWTKMLTRETINLWRAGRQLMSTNFEFVVKQSSFLTLDEFFLPVLFLTQVQQPNSIQIDGGAGGFKIVEQVPPIPVDIIIGNPNDPIIKLGRSIIKNLKVEVFDYKYKDGSFEETTKILNNDDTKSRDGIKILNNLLKNGWNGKSPKRVPTQQRISFDIDPIVPIVQFSESITKETNSPQGQSQLGR